MNIQITHTVTLAPEVLSLLQSFLGKASQSKPPIAPMGSAPLKKDEATPVPDAVEVKQEATATVSKASDITLERVREVVQKKAAAGKRESVKALLTEYGAENVTSLDVAHYEEFIQKVNAL